MSTSIDTVAAVAAQPADVGGAGGTAGSLRTAWIVAAVASVVAGLTHYAATGLHLPEDVVSALLFTLVGAAQIVWPVLLPRRERWVLVAGIALNVASVVAWALSRTVGLPIGHHAGEIEPVGLLDGASVIAEAVVVAIAVHLLRRDRGAAEPAESPTAL